MKRKQTKRIWIYRNKVTQNLTICTTPVKLSSDYYLYGRYILKGTERKAVVRKLKQMKSDCSYCTGAYKYIEGLDFAIEELEKIEKSCK